jgi:hypothetical protein
VEAEDWCEGVRGLATVRRLTRASWHPGWRSVVACPHRGAGGASEDGGRRYVARSEQADRLARPKGALLTSGARFRKWSFERVSNVGLGLAIRRKSTLDPRLASFRCLFAASG